MNGFANMISPVSGENSSGFEDKAQKTHETAIFHIIMFSLSSIGGAALYYFFRTSDWTGIAFLPCFLTGVLFFSIIWSNVSSMQDTVNKTKDSLNVEIAHINQCVDDFSQINTSKLGPKLEEIQSNITAALALSMTIFQISINIPFGFLAYQGWQFYKRKKE